jgi:ferredoxin
MNAMPTQIHLDNCDTRYLCADGLDVLRGMECLGRKGIPVGCRGGGCGVCKVRVLAGAYHTDTMSSACVSEQEQAEGYALACKLYAHEELHLEVVGCMARAIVRGAGNGFHFYGAPTRAPSHTKT